VIDTLSRRSRWHDTGTAAFCPLAWMQRVLVAFLINSTAGFLAPPLADALFPWTLLPGFVAEGALCPWLLLKGVYLEKWPTRQV
jgi:hypothetical protein